MPSRDTISTCVMSGNWRLGRAMHALFFVNERMVFSTFVETSLVDFYWKFGDPDMAFHVFDGMVEKNEVSWTVMISGYIEYHRAIAYEHLVLLHHPIKNTSFRLLGAHLLSLGGVLV
ncbi:hypothetical protein C2S53_018389 [Perilla frutescens var. hirtella]|uniref:Pentatricopeptide repeat-containing protein n=1 Tax=Perilla frutescens var. hirtella TaxID=608512 RepID=A0AAD4IQW8_PERFH|nr:hypothetical protein C2S53_018389 [Perilla frutescens var. hirtella]